MAKFEGSWPIIACPATIAVSFTIKRDAGPLILRLSMASSSSAMASQPARGSRFIKRVWNYARLQCPFQDAEASSKTCRNGICNSVEKCKEKDVQPEEDLYERMAQHVCDVHATEWKSAKELVHRQHIEHFQEESLEKVGSKSRSPPPRATTTVGLTANSVRSMGTEDLTRALQMIHRELRSRGVRV